MKVSTIAQQWQQFAERVLPPHCNPTQRQEMRRAFYAGAWSMFCVTSGEVTQFEDDADGARALEALRRECLAFSERVARGEA